MRKIIEYWLESAQHDHAALRSLNESGNRDWALFILHLIVEKTLKARWIFDHQEVVPPKTHSLDKLARSTNHPFTEHDLVWLVQANDFNIAARYPDYKLEFYRRATPEFTQEQINKGVSLALCVREKLLSEMPETL